MSIAEELIQKGREEGLQQGLQRGSLIGRVQTCQELLRLPVGDLVELEKKEMSELRALLGQLEAQLRSRLG